MARPKASLVRRVLIQTDRAFWCIHDHLDVLGWLGLPTLLAVIGSAMGLVLIWRAWEIPPAGNVLLAGFVAPLMAIVLFTVLPLPCAVFAWKAAEGERTTAGECFAMCRRRGLRLAGVVFRLILVAVPSALLFGLPLLWAWPRSCLAALVVLFEDERKVYRRVSKLLGEDMGIAVMGSLYLCMGLALGGIVSLPRLLVATPVLGANLLDAPWRRAILEYLWIFETITVASLLTAGAMTWWVSLALVYHDIRRGREGEDLRRRIAEYRSRHPA